MNKKIISFFSILLLVLGFSAQVVGAEENKNMDKLFSVSPLNPETKEPQSSYYDLTVKPNEEKELSVRIFNSSESPLKVNVELNNATTNNNGITSYQASEERDSSLKAGFSDIASVKESTITIKEKSYVDVPVQLKMPKESFKGSILGGIRISAAESDEEESKEQETAVKSKISYVVGVLLKESDEAIRPDIQLNDIITEQRNYRNYISANLQNKAPTMVKKLEVEAKVYKKGSNTVVYEASNSEMRMAPNSNFNFGINLENQPFKSGEYTMVLSGKADEEAFNFKKNFEITSKESNSFNKNAVYVEEDNTAKIILYILLGVLAVIVAVLGCYVYRLHKKRR
ncbi:DUF916 and DUF3324 domain-containing protein [Enterococcus faecalis]|uniref:DUF916 and DUF3324 domain-containing protein n=1 Tax=Enterococcus faecalis TaxID=1351 RepID=UPI002DB677C8|nr:DUF916 and DUF3324 domain-containing protein [Enterococcus faecalis]MEB7428079.1 DUF916 and DUF3324 domain-containing protein [Enterococcus faecalis]